MNNYFFSKAWTSIFIVSFLTIMPLSPILFFLKINGTLTYLLISVIFLLILILLKKIKKISNLNLLFFISILASFFPAIYWNEYRYIALPFFYFLSILIFSQLNNIDILMYVEFISKSSIVILIFSIIGSVNAIAGIKALMEILMADGRPSFLYFLTLTNVVVGNLIRPSGLFDEPGTLSFFVCFVVAIREIVGLPRRTTIFILLGGFVTLSLAHVIFSIFYLMHSKRFKVVLFISLFLIVFYFLLHYFDNSELNEVFLDRFKVVDGDIAGDNRSDMFNLALNSIDVKNFFWGLDSTCVFNRNLCHSSFGYMGENPLAPLLFSGFFVSFFYYFGLVYLFVISFSRKRCRFIYIGFIFLFFQRPYILTFGYSMMFAALIYAHRARALNFHTVKASN